MIYNTRTQSKEVFKPLKENQVNLYVCGVTPYDFCHMGHARFLVVFDMVVRYLRYLNYQVRYVRNITDIDDKIISRANEKNQTVEAFVEPFIAAMHEDAKALSVLPPDEEPRATQFMAEMIALVKTLVDKQFAYVAENGDVYFDVKRFKSYGELSHRNLEKLLAGARVEVSEYKKSPLDFTLWKLAKPNEPSFDSPWGPGRPGWHLECSAMSMAALGETFDIHGGGADLLFPHHENERAQSECATGKPFVHYWMHVGFLQVNQEKMSKSLGNFFTIRDVLKQFSPEVVRYFLLSSHYRSPLNYTEENLKQSEQALSRFYLTLRGLPLEKAKPDDTASHWIERFQEVMNDDFNTPEALAVLFELAREINRLREIDLKEALNLAQTLKQLANILGFLTQNPNHFLKGQMDADLSAEDIESMIAAREAARKSRDFKKADDIRQTLLKRGIILEDTAKGTLWRKQ